MTWEEWVNSEYNTIGAYVSDGIIKYGEGNTLYKDNTSTVGSNDIIISNYWYVSRQPDEPSPW